MPGPSTWGSPSPRRPRWAQPGRGRRSSGRARGSTPASSTATPASRPAGGDLEQLTLAAAGASTLRQFLADLTLDPPAATSDLAGPPHLDEDFVTISTIHSAKGCEWDVVHILHVADGSIPSDLSTGDPEAVEEERRLLYVAMTRARHHLYAYLPLRHHHRRYGQEDPHGYAQLTRFFTPAVLACLDDPPKPQAAGPGDGPSLNHMPDRPAMQRLDRAIASLWD